MNLGFQSKSLQGSGAQPQWRLLGGEGTHQLFFSQVDKLFFDKKFSKFQMLSHLHARWGMCWNEWKFNFSTFAIFIFWYMIFLIHDRLKYDLPFQLIVHLFCKFELFWKTFFLFGCVTRKFYIESSITQKKNSEKSENWFTNRKSIITQKLRIAQKKLLHAKNQRQINSNLLCKFGHFWRKLNYRGVV